jgi:hypothetical protein
MLSLASIRYRNILAEHGGPVERIDMGQFSVCGRQMFQANARLTAGFTAKRQRSIYSDADGTGTHRVATIARHMAVSEAMERWAFHATVRSPRAAEFGFDIDPSSNGMSAFPGLVRHSARRQALLEAVERFSLIAWWEGMAEGHLMETDWPGVSAVVIDGPFGGVTAIAFARTEWGGYVYGHAAEESIGAACERAVIELARHEGVLRAWRLAFASGRKEAPANLFERRCLFFASEEGYDLFKHRLHFEPHEKSPRPVIACDREIPGPWTEYATVWRFALKPPTDGYLKGGERYFFW